MTEQQNNDIGPENWNQQQYGYYQQQGYPQPGFQQQAPGNDSGFFSALFDFSFQKYATPSIVKMVYILVSVLLGLGALGWSLVLIMGMVDAMQWGSGGEAVLFLLGIPVVLLVVLLQLALFRVLLEAGLALVRAAQSLKALENR